MADCSKELMERFGYTAKDAEKTLEEARASAATSDERIRLAKERIKIDAANRAKAEFRAKLNAVKRADMIGHVEPFKDKYSAWEGLRSLTVGSDAKVPNARLSIHGDMAEATQTVGASVMEDLRKASGEDVFGWMADKDFDEHFGRTLFELGHREGPVSKSPQTLWAPKAEAAAKMYGRYFEAGRIGLNNVGADVGERVNYAGPQIHDAGKITKAGKEAWVNDILPLLNMEETFSDSSQGALKGRADPKEPLGQIWKKITDGTWGTYSNDRLAGGNLAERLGRSRELIFKDFDAYKAYNAKYGRGSFIENAQHHIENQQRNIALMNRAGTDPAGNIRKVIAHFGVEARPPDAELFGKKLGFTWKPSAEILAKTLLGLDNIPGDPRFANMMRYVRSAQDMAHLGSSFASQIPDEAAIGARAQLNGRSWLSSHADSMQSFIRGKASGEKRAIGESWSIYTDGVLGHVNQRLGAFDAPDGLRSKMTENFYKLAGITRWDDSHREGFGFYLLHELTKDVDAGKKWGDLNPAAQMQLQRYGIDASAWSKLNLSHVMEDSVGRRFLNSDAVPQDVAANLRKLFVSESQLALPLPGAYERAFLLRGMQPGTYGGELARFFARYKGVSFTMGTRVLPQVWQTGKIGAVAAFMVESAALGYLAVSARELMNGRTPPDPTHASVIGESLSKGGGLGYAGDLFINMGTDMNKSAMDVAAGVTGGTISNVWRIGQQIVDQARNPDKKHDIGAKVFRLAMNETPYVNLFYAKLALNYLFSWHVMEALNPGYLQRTEARIKQEQGNQYIVPPSSVIQRGGGFR